MFKNVYKDDNGHKICTSQTTAYYDSMVDIISTRIRDGEPKYILEGAGNFVIVADDCGILSVDIEVKIWNKDYNDVKESLKKAKIDFL